MGGIIMKKIIVGLIGLILLVASARAGSSVLEGIVKDAKGHPMEGADIRIETKNGGRLLTTVKTDVNGRYILDGLRQAITESHWLCTALSKLPSIIQRSNRVSRQS